MTKLEKIDKELSKAREKAAEWQAKIRDLEKQRQEEENSMIVQAVRSLKLTPAELAEFFSNPGITASGQLGAVDKVTFILVLTNKKDAHRRHPACFIIRFRFNAVADKRQWSSAASKPRRKTRAKLCSRFCAENEPSHQTCRSFSASR